MLHLVLDQCNKGADNNGHLEKGNKLNLSKKPRIPPCLEQRLQGVGRPETCQSQLASKHRYPFPPPAGIPPPPAVPCFEIPSGQSGQEIDGRDLRSSLPFSLAINLKDLPDWLCLVNILSTFSQVKRYPPLEIGNQTRSSKKEEISFMLATG